MRKVPDVTAQAAVDDFAPKWGTFREFFYSRKDMQGDFLTELDHAGGARTTWTVGEWQGRVTSTARWMQSQNVTEGSAVATLAGNSADALALAFACWVLGATCVPLNPGDAPDRHAYILKDAAAVLIVHSEQNRAVVELMDLGETRSVCTDDLCNFPLDPPATLEWSESRFGLDAPALCVYTSGTTGQPKGVVLTARNLLTDCDALQQALDWPQDTRVMTVLPVHHVNGLVISSLLPWCAGYTTVLCDRFQSDSFWTDVRAESATVCSMVPSLLEFLLQGEGTRPASFREVLCGAGPLLPDTALAFEDAFDVPVRHLYGLSETTAVVTVTPRMEEVERRHWHRTYGAPSIGPAVPHVEVAIHDARGQALPEGQRGEIVIRGAVVMSCYAGLPEETQHALRGGWFHSGDEGFWVLAEGGDPYYFITGRIKELIIRGGVNISPVEIDAVLRKHPAVEFGLAIGFDNRFYGEEIAAYVVTSAAVSDEELLAHCARHLDYARQPKVIVRGTEVPFTTTGKAKRLELRKMLAPQFSEFRDVQFRRSAAKLGGGGAVASDGAMRNGQSTDEPEVRLGS